MSSNLEKSKQEQRYDTITKRNERLDESEENLKIETEVVSLTHLNSQNPSCEISGSISVAVNGADGKTVKDSVPILDENGKPLSKNQLKKRKRYEKLMAIKKRKKEQDKQAKAEKAKAEGRYVLYSIRYRVYDWFEMTTPYVSF